MAKEDEEKKNKGEIYGPHSHFNIYLFDTCYRIIKNKKLNLFQ